jgi:hypothetical protein
MTIAKAIRNRRSKKVGSVRMSLLNRSKRTDAEVWQAVRYATSGLTMKQHPNIDVSVLPARWWRATYYPSGFNGPNPLVVAGATTDETKFPYRHEPTGGGGYLPDLWLDSTECLISMLAHEFCHGWQEEHKGRKRGKAWGARGVYSNRDADAYAIRKTREYRRSPERLQKYEEKVAEVVKKLLPSFTYTYLCKLLRLQ